MKIRPNTRRNQNSAKRITVLKSNSELERECVSVVVEAIEEVIPVEEVIIPDTLIPVEDEPVEVLELMEEKVIIPEEVPENIHVINLSRALSANPDYINTVSEWLSKNNYRITDVDGLSRGLRINSYKISEWLRKNNCQITVASSLEK